MAAQPHTSEQLEREAVGSDEHAGRGPSAAVARTSIVVAVCTYRRNGPLTTLLESTLVAARVVEDRAAVGVVIVDDDPDGGARPVVTAFAERFELGAHYRHSGRRNLSIARNLSLEAAAPLAEWVVMTDDDCEPRPEWFAAHLEAQRKTGCDATTGSMALQAPPDAPRWLVEEPFFRDYAIVADDLEELKAAGTNNLMLRSAWLLAHADIRFLEELGRVGGEDWVFLCSATKAGMTLRFAAEAEIVGHEPPARLKWGYLLKNRFWLGNAEWHTNHLVQDAPHTVLVERGWDRLGIALIRLVRGLPRYRYSVARLSRSLGYLAGMYGVRVRHH